jgi:membrane protease YdiL (CAAX protease family)
MSVRSFSVKCRSRSPSKGSFVDGVCASTVAAVNTARVRDQNRDLVIFDGRISLLITPRPAVLLAIGIEIAYAVFSRTWLRTHTANPIQLEAATTVLRLVVAGLHWILLRDLIRQRKRDLRPISSRWFFLGVGLLLISPAASGLRFGATLAEQATRSFFSLTSIVVGLREELFYRGVLQNVLEKRMALPAALLVSNVLFALYHYGAQPMTVLSVIKFMVLGSFMGLVYFTTRSVMVVALIHAGYDMISAFTPIETVWTMLIQFVALAIVFLWSARSKSLLS